MILTVDPTVSGDVVLEVTTDSNIQEFLTTTVSGAELSVSTDRNGGVTPSGPFDVSGTIAIVRAVSADNGAEVRLSGSVGDVTLSATAVPISTRRRLRPSTSLSTLMMEPRYQSVQLAL